jgi:putative ABC transport system permease protein
MIIFESIKLALTSIWGNKSRSFLTMLGIIIGITSVVSLMAMGEGVKKEVEKTVNNIGTNMIFVFGGNVQIKQTSSSQNASSTSNGMASMGNPADLISGDILKYSDVESIRKIDGIEAVAPMSLIAGSLSNGEYISTSTLTGSEPDIVKIASGFKIGSGRFFDETDNEKNVIIIGDSTRTQLFGNETDAVGKKIKLGSDDFEIIGIFKKSASSNLFGDSFDSLCIIPMSTAKKLNGGKEKIMRILLKAKDGVNVKDISKKIEEDMLIRHKKEDFSVITQEDALGMYDSILNLLTTFMAAIAAISLVVGGVGIMNIMLVSVTERTREIGLRKALGATDGIILFQFLIESVMISLIAGIISLGLVRIIAQIVKIKINIEPIITPHSLILSISVCVLVGLIFGLAPAIGAARKNPIDALKYE